MTAILGMTCLDGVLMLADTEETLLGGAAKSECDKLHRFPFLIGRNPSAGCGTVITGGAGDSHLIECANQELKQFFQASIERNTDILTALNSFAGDFFKETMEPYKDAADCVYVPEVEMVITVCFSLLRNNLLRLLSGGANQFPGGSCTAEGKRRSKAHCYDNDEAGNNPLRSSLVP